MFVLALVLIAIGSAMRMLDHIELFTRRDPIFVVFFLISHEAWLLMFAIQRFAIALEILGAPRVKVCPLIVTPVAGGDRLVEGHADPTNAIVVRWNQGG